MEYAVTEVVEFDLTVTVENSDTIPAYTLYVTVDDPSKLSGTFFASYWTDPGNDNTRTDIPFPTGTGIEIGGLSSASIKLCLYVHCEESPSEPDKPVEDAAFKFRVTAGA